MVGRVIDFEQAKHELSATKVVTLDKQQTKNSLRGEIVRYVDNLPIPDNEKVAIYTYVVTSFSKTGLVEVYNDLGADKWLKEMQSMVYNEYMTRKHEKMSCST